MNFSDLNLSDKLLKAIDKLGYLEPTDIQKESIPKLMKGDIDFVGQAQTGTGKTAAFVLPLLDNLNVDCKSIQALILTPTRELANQVCEEIEKLGEFTDFRSYAVFGGISYDKQIRDLKKNRPQIIVGTPGRLIDLMNQKVLDFSSANFLILDEADEMLNMGFLDDVKNIVHSFSDKKNMWMFSATMPKQILELVRNDFSNPEIVKVKKESLSNADIKQLYYTVKSKERETALCRIVDSDPDLYGIVFCNTKKDTWELTDSLLARGYKVDSLHGDMGQMQRDQSMARFKAGKSRLMICTDVAARGIDVNNLTHVINYGLPRDMESYVHRIGRTGRAGVKGISISFIDPRERGYLKRIERFINMPILQGTLPTVKQMKKGILNRELEKTNNLIEAIMTKGDGFQIDELYHDFAEHFSALDREQLLKVIFSWQFNKTFKSLQEMTNFETAHVKEVKRPNVNKGRGPRVADRKNQRFFIKAGKTDGVKLQNLLNAVSKKTGINKNDIHNVEMMKKFSFFEVSKRYEQKVKGIDISFGSRSVVVELSN